VSRVAPIAKSFDEGHIVTRKSPFHIELSTLEAAELNRRVIRYTLPYFEVVRAKMILMAAHGLDNDEIAARLDTRREVVSQWRKRFFHDRLSGLEERARPGRPRTLSPRS
jgi:hypothetical protein